MSGMISADVKSEFLDAEHTELILSKLFNSSPSAPTEPPALEDDGEADREVTVDPKSAEEEADEIKEDESDEVGVDDKATVDVVKPLAGPEDTESRAQAAGRRRSGTSAAPPPASNRPHGCFFSSVLLPECPCVHSAKQAVSKATPTKGW